MQDHQEDTDAHDDLDGCHIGAPGGVAALAIFERVGCAGKPAIHEEDQVGDQEKDSEHINPGFGAWPPAAIGEVHAHMVAQLQGVGAAKDVVGHHGELRHFQRPERRDEEGFGDG